jgi:hypothetical protein
MNARTTLVDDVRSALVGREAAVVFHLLPDGVLRGGEWWAPNPARADHHLGSFSVAIDGERAGQWYDFATADGGDLFDLARLVTGADFKGAVQYLARAVGIHVPDPRLVIRRPAAGAVAEWKRKEASGELYGRGCTVADLAAAKKLPEKFLRGLGLRDLPARPATAEKQAYVQAVSIPYANRAGDVVATRIRSDIIAKDGSRWVRGATLIPYGLDRLHGDERELLLVEGESDCWCCWFSDVPAIGIPGAGTWKNERALLWPTLLPPTATIYVNQEPDDAGAALIETLRQSPLRARLRAIRMPLKDAA